MKNKQLNVSINSKMKYSGCPFMKLKVRNAEVIIRFLMKYIYIFYRCFKIHYLDNSVDTKIITSVY